MRMPRLKKLAVDTFTGVDAPLEEGSTPSGPTGGPGAGAPVLTWISMSKVAGGFAVLKATTCGHDVLGVEVLAGPMNRGGATAALRVETARQFLVGRGPK
jgi:hypothetical protein